MSESSFFFSSELQADGYFLNQLRSWIFWTMLYGEIIFFLSSAEFISYPELWNCSLKITESKRTDALPEFIFRVDGIPTTYLKIQSEKHENWDRGISSLLGGWNPVRQHQHVIYLWSEGKALRLECRTVRVGWRNVLRTKECHLPTVHRHLVHLRSSHSPYKAVGWRSWSPQRLGGRAFGGRDWTWSRPCGLWCPSCFHNTHMKQLESSEW